MNFSNRAREDVLIVAAYMPDVKRPYSVYLVPVKNRLVWNRAKRFESATDALQYVQRLQTEEHILIPCAALMLFRAHVAKNPQHK